MIWEHILWLIYPQWQTCVRWESDMIGDIESMRAMFPDVPVLALEAYGCWR